MKIEELIKMLEDSGIDEYMDVNIEIDNGDNFAEPDGFFFINNTVCLTLPKGETK